MLIALLTILGPASDTRAAGGQTQTLIQDSTAFLSIGGQPPVTVTAFRGNTLFRPSGGGPPVIENVTGVTIFHPSFGFDCWIIPDDAYRVSENPFGSALHLTVTETTRKCPGSASLIGLSNRVTQQLQPQLSGSPFPLPMAVDVTWTSDPATVDTTTNTSIERCGTGGANTAHQTFTTNIHPQIQMILLDLNQGADSGGMDSVRGINIETPNFDRTPCT